MKGLTNQKRLKTLSENEMCQEKEMNGLTNQNRLKTLSESEMRQEKEMNGLTNQKRLKTLSENEMCQEREMKGLTNQNRLRILSDNELCQEKEMKILADQKRLKTLTENEMFQEKEMKGLADQKRERDVSRKRNERSNKSETVKNIVRERDVSKKRNERSNKSETDKDFEKERDVNRKRSKRHEKYPLESRTVREKETANGKKSRMTTSVQSALINFKRAIKAGAVYECNSCARLMFRRSVITYVNSKYRNKELIENIDSFRKGEATNWICQTCESSLKRGSMPSLCLLNNLSLESVPDELKCITSLELQLVSQMLPFMKVIALHTGAQHKLSGQVVLVPADLSKVATSLPRNTASAQIVTLALELRVSDKHPYHQQIIRPAYVNSNWEEDSTENSSELWSAATGNLQNDKQVDRNHGGAAEDTECQSHRNECEASDTHEGQKPSHNNEVTDSEDEVDCDNPIEIQEELLNKASLNAVTCIQSVNGPEVQTAHVKNIAPAEGQTPTSYFKQPELGGPYLKKYFNQRLTNKDPRKRSASKQHFIDNQKNNTRRYKCRTVFRSIKSVRATPQYWQQMQLDMLAKLRQLGLYTFFLTGSAAEFHWTEVIQVVAKQYGTSLSDEEIENMDWNTKRSWLQRNPVSVARQIDYIFEQLFGKVILSGCHPIGCILDKNRNAGERNTAFSLRNSCKGCKLDTNSDEECIKFIDTYITCEIPDPEEDQELYSLVQRQCHHHTRTCKKNKNKTCRFSYPKTPSPETCIARVPEGENSDTLKEEARLVLQKVHQLITSPESEFDGMSTLDVILQMAGVSSNEYVSALQVAQRRTVLKRSPQEIMVNNYNKDILRALRANMDIQFITNIWACIAYLTS
ncbi:hypothetical protein MAR_005868 [Mya arenaria]|uniref:Uncharacterized protein n=1 Tax=Mya arenaria TaxID=6604 RepID=A0ABY7F0Q5_MYAAR|nr:hypothetical protein MAR_005868 [Mya arenaria]